MAFCHIYARRDGTFSVRMHGAVSKGTLKGTGEFSSQPFESEAAARGWISAGRQSLGLEDMPEPTIIRRARKVDE